MEYRVVYADGSTEVVEVDVASAKFSNAGFECAVSVATRSGKTLKSVSVVEEVSV